MNHDASLRWRGAGWSRAASIELRLNGYHRYNPIRYSATYEMAIEPDAFTFGCGTMNHTGAGVTNPDLPQYGSLQG